MAVVAKVEVVIFRSAINSEETHMLWGEEERSRHHYSMALKKSLSETLHSEPCTVTYYFPFH